MEGLKGKEGGTPAHYPRSSTTLEYYRARGPPSVAFASEFLQGLLSLPLSTQLRRTFQRNSTRDEWMAPFAILQLG